MNTAMSSTMSMVMSTMSSMSGAAPTSTMSSMTARASAGGHDHSGMGGMMGGGPGRNTCKISMLWNWYTIDSCFIARSWHVRSRGAFAGSCIGVILLVIALEFLRRTQREFDRYVRALNRRNVAENSSGSENGSSDNAKVGTVRVAALGAFRTHPPAGASKLKLWQHMIRSLLYMLQFAVGYFIMLLAMYYNGYIIICIFIGAFFGAMIFQWDTLYHAPQAEQRDSCCN